MVARRPRGERKTMAKREEREVRMTEAAEGTPLWQPSEEFKENANISRYMEWLDREKGLSFDNYGELWEWSVNELEEFWVSIWEYFEVQTSRPYERVLGSHEMPGA